MRLIIKSVSEEVALRKNRKAVAVHKRCESSPKENFGRIAHLFEVFLRPVLYSGENGISLGASQRL